MFVKESHRKNTIIILLVGTFVLISYFKITNTGIFSQKAVTSQTNQAGTNQRDSYTVSTSLTPSAFPFQELTIPYLQNKTYSSQMGEMTLNSYNDEYRSYLTSYQSDGLQIYGQLTIPEGEPPENGWPAVVFVHGYIPPQTYETFSNYAAYVDYLARNGMVVFKIDLRGHGNSEGEASGAYYSTDYVSDVLHAYAALENKEEVNPNQIFLWGHSMAGNVILKALVAKPTIPKAVIFAGAVYSYEDFLEYGISDNSYRPPDDDSKRSKRRSELFDTYGSFSPESDFWKQVPATNYLDAVNAEIQIHHATNDDVVNSNYSKDLVKRLDTASIENQLFEYQSGGHNISGSAFTTAMQRTVNFFLGN